MHVPDTTQLDDKSNEEIIEFWFNYWNSLYPVPALKIAFETEGYIAKAAGYADSDNRKTAFNPKRIKREIGFRVTRHEHVHQLLSEHGYDNTHKLLFALVDNALSYGWAKAMGESDPENSVRHYDVHEQVTFSHYITTRHFLVFAKRLSRHVDDITTLLSTAQRYATALEQTRLFHPCKRIALAHQVIGQEHFKLLDAKSHINRLQTQLDEQTSRFAIISAKLKFSFLCLTTATVYLIIQLYK